MSTSIIIKDLEPNRENEWDDFVLKHQHGLVYYGLQFRNFLKMITGGIPKYRIALQDDKIRGVLPVFEKDGKYGKVINSLPFFGTYGEPLAISTQIEELLKEDWNQISSSEGVASATLIQNPRKASSSNVIPVSDEIDQRISQFTNLSNENYVERTILSKIDSSARRNINKAIRNDIKVVVEAEAIKFLEDIHIENMMAINGVPKPSIYFNAIIENFEFQKDWKLYVAYKGNKRLAAVLVLYGGTVVEYLTPAITQEGRETQATALILLTAMEDAIFRGMKFWNWGGTWQDQDGVFRFKKKWGAESNNYFYFTKIKNKDLYKVSIEEIKSLYPYFYVLPFGAIK